MDEDYQHIRDTLSGHGSAYTHLVNKYKSYMYTLLLGQIGSEHLAEEAAQDVFVKAYRGLSKFRFDSKFSTWLYRIAYRVGLDYLKKKKPKIGFTYDITAQGLQIPSYEPTADQQIQNREVRQLLEKAIGDLDEQSADIIRLFYLHEKSISEIEEVTGMNKNNIKIKLFRGRKKLRENLSVSLLENSSYHG